MCESMVKVPLHMLVVISTKVSGRMVESMVKVPLHLLMVISTKVSGRMKKGMVKVPIHMLMVISTKVSIRMVESMVKVSIHLLVVISTKVSGRMIILMVKALRLQRTDLLFIMVNGEMISQWANHTPKISVVGSPRKDMYILVGRRDTSGLDMGYWNTIQKNHVQPNV